MKIGQVAKKYGLSIDTVNYYVSYGLLVPPRKGGQRSFDERTLKDLELILRLRGMEFSLQEIHRILSLYRISLLASRQDAAELQAIYEKKRRFCMDERKRLLNVAKKLDGMISELQRRGDGGGRATGVPLSMLDLLRCPECGGTFEINGASMNQRYIFSGECRCACGYSAEIRNGMLITPIRNKDKYDKPDTEREMYKNLPPSLLSLFQSSYNWMTQHLDRVGTGGKVTLETHVNAWCFSHNHQESFAPSSRQIIVDKYPETLAMYKALIDEQRHGGDILYIADGGFKWPLADGCVDVNIDFFAVNEHYFYSDVFLFDDIKRYLSDNALMLGVFFYFSDGVRSMKRLLAEYPTCARYNFSLPHFERSLKRSGFRMTEREECGYTTSSGDNIGFSFHQEGERMYLMPYAAVRAGVSG